MPTAAQRKKGVTTKKFDSCVSQVKAKSPGKNAYAVCNASFNKKKPKK